jgi:hypothetical protein
MHTFAAAWVSQEQYVHWSMGRHRMAILRWRRYSVRDDRHPIRIDAELVFNEIAIVGS